MMEQDFLQGINVVRHKYSNQPNFKGKLLFLKFCKKCSRSRHSISTCPDKRYTKPFDKPNLQKQSFNQAMKGNQNLPNKQVISNNMTGKPLPFLISLGATVEIAVITQDTEVKINPHLQTLNLIMAIVILNYRVETVHLTQDLPMIRMIRTIILITHIQKTLDHNHLIIMEMEII